MGAMRVMPKRLKRQRTRQACRLIAPFYGNRRLLFRRLEATKHLPAVRAHRGRIGRGKSACSRISAMWRAAHASARAEFHPDMARDAHAGFRSSDRYKPRAEPGAPGRIAVISRFACWQFTSHGNGHSTTNNQTKHQDFAGNAH